jgi:hypothetical protein
VAINFPMPLPPPVTRATLPLNPNRSYSFMRISSSEILDPWKTDEHHVFAAKNEISGATLIFLAAATWMSLE